MAARRGPDPGARPGPAQTVTRAHGDDELGLGANPLDDLDADDPVVSDFYASTWAPVPVRAPVTPPPARVTLPTTSPTTSPTNSTKASTTAPMTAPMTAPESPKARASRGRGRQPLADGRTFRLVTFSFYEDDVARLDALLQVARQKGHRRANRSQLVRLAIRQIDLDALPDDV